MKLFTCTDHDGHYPVGVAAVIWAPTRQIAEHELKHALVAEGLDPSKPFTLTELETDKPFAKILNNGDY